MDDFWKAALGVAGLGAVVSFVYWSLYKRVLALGVVPKLTKRQGFAILVLLLVFTFGFALAGLGTYAYIKYRESHLDVSTRELLDEQQAGRERGLKRLEELRKAAPTTQAAAAIESITRAFDEGTKESIDALRRGQMSRYHNAQQRIWSQLMMQENLQYVPDMLDFIHNNAAIDPQEIEDKRRQMIGLDPERKIPA